MELAKKFLQEQIQLHDYWIRSFQPYFMEPKEKSEKRINKLKMLNSQLKSVLDGISDEPKATAILPHVSNSEGLEPSDGVAVCDESHTIPDIDVTTYINEKGHIER